MSVKFRRDIQGLRGLAVIAVLVFHSGLTLSGGFLGVDIFFVVSGYVIGGLLLRRRFTRFRDFWISRFLRLAPAASALIGFTTLVVLTFFWGQSYTNLPGVALAGLVGLANIIIALNVGDYFDTAAEQNPLLHIWTLSVESQVYFFLPLLIAFLSWRKRAQARRVVSERAIITTLIVSSLLLAILGSSENRGVLGFGEGIFGFYSPVSRLWEFMVGVYVAHRRLPQIRSLQSQNLLAALGTALVLFALLVQNETRGWSVLFVGFAVSGTAILLGTPESWVAKKLLSNKAIVWVGDRSYSLYLWHWPFVVLASELWPGNANAAIAATIVSCVPAYISHRFLEVPFRGSKVDSEPARRKPTVTAVVIVLLSVAAVSPGLATKDGSFRFFPENDKAGEIQPVTWFTDLEEPFGICTHPVTGETSEGGTFHHCIGDFGEGLPDLILLGDSHAAHYFAGLAKIFPNKNIMFLGVPVEHLEDRKKKSAYTKFLRSNPNLSAVLVSYRWETMEKIPRFADILTETSQRDSAEVFVFNGTPSFDFDPIVCKSGYGVFSLAPNCESPEDIEPRKITERMLLAETSRLESVTVLDSMGQICVNARCHMAIDGVLLFADRHHLNWSGSMRLVEALFDESSP